MGDYCLGLVFPKDSSRQNLVGVEEAGPCRFALLLPHGYHTLPLPRGGVARLAIPIGTLLMSRMLTRISILTLAIGCLMTQPTQADSASADHECSLSFKVESIDGKPVDLHDYEGKVVLIVNVASKCGLTKQYDGLQSLYEKYKDKGLVILGVPLQ